MFAIGRPSYGVHHVGVFLVDDSMIFAGSIPYMYCLVIAGRGNALAIRGPCYRTHPPRVTMISVFGEDGEDVMFGGNILDLDGLIVASRGKARAIGGPCYGTHPV